jgi:hypothetical protein
MVGPAAAYVVAFSMLAFCGLTALTLINTVRHLDPPETGSSAEEIQDKEAA